MTSTLRELFRLDQSWTFSGRTGENVWPDSESFGDSSAALGKCPGQLSDQNRKRHIERSIQSAGL